MTIPVLVFDPTLFRQQFPAYSNATTYPDALLQMYWDMATCYISDLNYGCLQGTCRVLAINLMTAHLLYISDLIAAGEVPTIVNNATIDKISVGLTPPPIKNQWQWWLNTSPYGGQLLTLLSSRSVGGFWTGGLPELSAFRRVGGLFG